MPKSSKKKCLTRGCDRQSDTRGVCSGCRATFERRIKAGDVSWEELEEAGAILPANRRRSPAHAVVDRLSSAAG